MTTTQLDRRGFLRTTGIGALALAAGGAALGTAPQARAAEPKKLDYTWQQQRETYYCGPTALAFAVSARSGGKPDQGDMANVLGTTAGGTNFGAMTAGLTQLVDGGTYTGAWMESQTATQADADTLWARAKKNVDDGFATVCNWVVVPGDYPGWNRNTGTIYHYTTIVGYDEAKKTLRVADPAGTTLSPDLPPEHELSVMQVATYCAGRGYFY